MSLKKRSESEKSDMYEFVTHIWNPVRGKCAFDCSYCYAKRWGELGPLHLDEKDLSIDLGSDRFIFVCSGCDLFHGDVSHKWIEPIITASETNGRNNSYLWHTKNPEQALEFQVRFGERDMLCVTIETNRHYEELSKAPCPIKRFNALYRWKKPWMLTIEPIIDFDIDDFTALIKATGNLPVQINIGADTGNNRLPEPPAWKIKKLINNIEKYPSIKVHLKKNIYRLLSSQGGENGEHREKKDD